MIEMVASILMHGCLNIGIYKKTAFITRENNVSFLVIDMFNNLIGG